MFSRGYKNFSRTTLTFGAIFLAAFLFNGCSKPPAEQAREVSEKIKIENGAPETAGQDGGPKLETVAVKDLPGDAVKHLDEKKETAKVEAPKPEEPKVEKPKVAWTAKKTEPVKETPKKAEQAKEPVKKAEPSAVPAKVAVKTAPAPEKAVEKKTAQAKPVVKIDPKKSYIVNVASFNGRAKADEIMGILAKRGDNVYMTEFAKDGKDWYRVRVGFFTSFSKASAYAKKVSAHPDMKDAWVTKPSAEEVSKYAK